MRKLVRRGGLAASIFGGLAIVLSGYQSATTPFRDWPAFATPSQKLVTHYSYFTLWSNIIGTYIATQYARERLPQREAFLRINAVTMLAITGVVFNTLLAKTSVIEGLGKFTNPIVHTAMPIALPALWVADRTISQQRDMTVNAMAWSFTIPAVWLAYTFCRGARTGGYYPYEFLNPTVLGYPAAIRNVCGVAAVLGLLLAAMTAVEKQLIKQ
ncbi:Pr6Pr family membrane protein [Corynebacterium sp. H130]|uniref:Pr6Pr family membrane protein n=1 Tax=Corynebacterium sp. H130 TaxID=3133444 RepID=UPI0030A539C9